MCGIAGYTGKSPAEIQVIEILRKLEHRGYDSAGLAVVSGKEIYVLKATGKISNLEDKLKNCEIDSHTGIGHTRWATHGSVCIENTHPHLDCKKHIAVVHNGIIENYREIKRKLEQHQHKFQSATDTEVIPHLIEDYIEMGNPVEKAFLKAINRLKGSFAVAAIFANDKRIFFAQKNSTLIIYQGIEDMYLVSDPAGLPECAKDIIPVQDDEWGIISSEGLCLFDVNGKIKKPQTISLNHGFKTEGNQHFLLKEILEQPETIISTLRSSLLFFDTHHKEFFKNVTKILIIGCGSSYYAGLIGKYFFEKIANIPAVVEYASEIWHFTDSIEKTAMSIALSQSGETRDTISAIKKMKNARILAITNVPGSLITRIVPDHILLCAGPEISVAATKSFTSQIVCLYMVSLKVAYEKKLLSLEKTNEMIVEILKLSHFIEKLFPLIKPILQDISRSIKDAVSIFVLGRGISYPVALEGALKLKEVSGVHAEGLPAAEMKHGPISLIKEKTPVFFIAPEDETYQKSMNNIEEIKSRGGRTIVITTESNSEMKKIVDEVIYVPDAGYLSPICCIIPFQFLSYFLALEKGMPVDRPRNLAKTVTVE